MAETGLPDLDTPGPASWHGAGWRAPDRTTAWRIGAAIAVSLALHGALLYGYRVSPPAAVPAAPPPLTVWLQPAPAPTPRAPAKPEPKPAEPAKREPKPAEPARKEAKKPPARLRSVAPAAPATTGTPVPTMPGDRGKTEPLPNSASGDAPAEPKFDMEAARKAAREIASKPDPERAATAVGQIPPKPIADETPLARHIASAKRGDCKNQPGGLLAPLIMLLDKKDSGCKL